MTGSIQKLAIANRGEVAVRILRACQELDIQTVLLHSEADRETMAYRLCNEAICLGPAPSNQSYLNIDANITAALSVGADAIHPGFGFLSENANFAEACEDNKIIFVGPSAQCLRLFGDKVSAKELVTSAGVPVLQSYQGPETDTEFLKAKCDEIGYPLMVKARAGGGGRGLKVIRKGQEAQAAIESAQREGLSSFGSDRIFLEKYLERCKHIEFQIFVDSSGHVFSLGERECSVQRRHQKIIEEAPAIKLDPTLRLQMSEAAKTIAKAAKYKGAGTVEFLVEDNNFYFLEMNTRLQVEHSVTEQVLSIDLVKAQILTAQDSSLTWVESELIDRGHAIECRIYAEDPYQNGLPSTGRLGSCHWPQGPGRRFELGFEAGDEITSFYDSMIAKLIVHDETRVRALQKMKATLKDTIIFGLKTNIPYLLEILDHEEFISGEMTTQFIQKHFPKV